MKTQTITLTHLPDILLVKLPEKAHNFRIDKGYLWYDDGNFKDVIHPAYLSQKHDWRIVSTLADLKEEWCKGVVESNYVFTPGEYHEHHTLFYNYGSKSYSWEMSALESFHSAIVASGWFLENKERCPKLSDYDDNCFGVTSWSDMPLIDQFQKEKWEKAQSRTLDPELTLILERK